MCVCVCVCVGGVGVVGGYCLLEQGTNLTTMNDRMHISFFFLNFNVRFKPAHLLKEIKITHTSTA